jgi:hypothetical protein
MMNKSKKIFKKIWFLKVILFLIIQGNIRLKQKEIHLLGVTSLNTIFMCKMNTKKIDACIIVV